MVREWRRLKKIDDLTYIGECDSEHPAARVFGGHVLAQAMSAAYYTAPEGFYVHAVHCYFIRGDRRMTEEGSQDVSMDSNGDRGASGVEGESAGGSGQESIGALQAAWKEEKAKLEQQVEESTMARQELEFLVENLERSKQECEGKLLKMEKALKEEKKASRSLKNSLEHATGRLEESRQQVKEFQWIVGSMGKERKEIDRRSDSLNMSNMFIVVPIVPGNCMSLVMNFLSGNKIEFSVTSKLGRMVSNTDPTPAMQEQQRQPMHPIPQEPPREPRNGNGAGGRAVQMKEEDEDDIQIIEPQRTRDRETPVIKHKKTVCFSEPAEPEEQAIVPPVSPPRAQERARAPMVAVKEEAIERNESERIEAHGSSERENSGEGPSERKRARIGEEPVGGNIPVPAQMSPIQPEEPEENVQRPRQNRTSCHYCLLRMDDEPSRMFCHVVRHLKFKPYQCTICPRISATGIESTAKKHFAEAHPHTEFKPFVMKLNKKQRDELVEMVKQCFPGREQEIMQ